MTGAWLPNPADLADTYIEVAAAPTISTLPIPDEEQDAVAKAERERKARGIGFTAP